MTVTVDAVEPVRHRAGILDKARDVLPKIVLAPSFALILFFVYGFILWTLYLSFTKSTLLPVYELAGFDAYVRLWSQPNWYVALTNLAIFSIGDGGAILEAIASGVSVDDVRARTGFSFREAEPVAQLADPPEDVLAAIHRIDPDNLRADLVGQLN